MKNYTHLHLHTEYSLLDGVGKITDYMNKAKNLGMTSIAITDHGNLFGAIEFYKKAKEIGIKPIIGLEAYVAEFKMEEKSGRIFHLVLLAENNKGYENLLKISSESYIKGFYYKPRIDKEFLKSHSEGIIALSACMQGEIPRRILDNEKEEDIINCINEYTDIFGKDNFYLEVQSNGIAAQDIVNERLYKLSNQIGLSLVATNDTHYVNKGDHPLQDIIICIQTAAKVNDYGRMKIETDQLYFKSYDETVSSFDSKYQEAIDNTSVIASRCNVDIEFGVFKFPDYEVPAGYKSIEDYLRRLVFKGLQKRYSGDKLTSEIKERAKFELSVIEKMGYAAYFIVVWDFIYFSKKNGIPIGPGRGSAAGSLVAYSLGITEVDPIKYNLLFERFLNPERISMPDIDIDICRERRQEVIEYVTKKYGDDRVAQIITFGTLKAKAAIRDVGRVLDVPLSKINALAKVIPFNGKLKILREESEEFKKIYNSDPELKNVIDISERLENKVRHASIHAAGIVITKEPLDKVIPLYSDNKNSTLSTQYQMKELEELGILKMDFLGLNNLTILKRAADYVEVDTGIHINLQDLPLDSKEVYDMLSKGDTSGVFQLESTGIRRVLFKLKPDKFQDIIAVLALYRPGPLGSGMVDDFINCKNGVSKIKFPHPDLSEILEETYGVILYQEQVMKIASKMASYSLGEADLLRRAMGKKNFKIMQENKEKFVKRSIKNGYTESKAIEIFDLIDKFAGYGFNKSHSAAYALIAYWTAYFKVHYMKYYYAAILTSGMGHVENTAYYVNDAKNHNVKLYLPNINRASSKFIVKGDGIVFGLTAIKNVGFGTVEGIVEELEKNGEYKNLEDFVMRTKKYGLNKKSLESLILAGALDSLPGNRKQKYLSIDRVLEFANRKITEDEIQQMNLFGEAKSMVEKFIMPESSDFKIEEKLSMEKENLGFYFSGHPLDKYKYITSTYKLLDVKTIEEEKNINNVKTYGILRNVKKIVTKRTGDIMGTFLLEDYINQIQGIIFPNLFKEYAHILLEGRAVYIEGYVQIDSFNDQDTAKLIVRKIRFLEDIIHEYNFKAHIFVEINDKLKYYKLKEIIKKHSGNIDLYFSTIENNKKQTKPSKYKIQPSEEFIKEIKSLLGENRIIIK
ncbi:DNA polymerase III subunit alpha [Fusobacterium sp. PH5-44]|uniref:DNA polymerase III subunit alpha n=1 Tax=unclassified Fusobacterium TaxID=2648384 RepID=UPI003D1D603F